MSVKINIGLSRKVGEQNFGSRGASVNMEVELESSLMSDPARFRSHVKRLYAMARRSVNDELKTPFLESNQVALANEMAERTHSSTGNGRSNLSESDTATQSQVRAIFAIARQRGLDPYALSKERFNAESPKELTRSRASSLIDHLKQHASVVGDPAHA